MLPKKRGQKKNSSMKKIMQTRRAEKAAENLFRGWSALEKGNAKTGLSFYLQAVKFYGAKFNAVQLELNAAKQKGFLPSDFPIPKNAEQLKEILKNLQTK